MSLGSGVELPGFIVNAGLMALVPLRIEQAAQLGPRTAETFTGLIPSVNALESGRIVTVPPGGRRLATDIRVVGPGRFHVSVNRGLGSDANWTRSHAVTVRASPSS